MTTETSSSTNWSRSENRILPPYPRIGNALESCLFASHSEDALSTQPTRYVSETLLLGGIEPRFALAVDNAQFDGDSDIQGSDLSLLLSARDYSAKSYVPLGRWPLQDIPGEWSVSASDQIDFNSASGLEFAVSICLSKQLEQSPNLPFRKGSVLDQRTYSVRPERSGPTFPHRFVNMSKEGWTDGALWGVHYFAKGDVESLNQSAAEVLEVHIAQEAEQKLVALAGRGAAGRLFVQEMASDIVADVAMTCLRLIADDAEDFHFDNPDGVGHQIITKLMASTGLAQDVLTDWAIESPEKLKAAVQSMVGLADQVIQSSPSK